MHEKIKHLLYFALYKKINEIFDSRFSLQGVCARMVIVVGNGHGYSSSSTWREGTKKSNMSSVVIISKH